MLCPFPTHVSIELWEHFCSVSYLKKDRIKRTVWRGISLVSFRTRRWTDRKKNSNRRVKKQIVQFSEKIQFQVKVLTDKNMDYNSNMHKDDDFDGYSHVNHNSGNGSHLQNNKSGMSKAELRKVGLTWCGGRWELFSDWNIFYRQTNLSWRKSVERGLIIAWTSWKLWSWKLWKRMWVVFCFYKLCFFFIVGNLQFIKYCKLQLLVTSSYMFFLRCG